MSYVPLHVHSQYSILEASSSIDDLLQKAKEYQLSSLALTDISNLFAAVEFYKACKQANIQAIIGCSLYCSEGSRHEKTRANKYFHQILLLAKNETGYKNLCVLSSKAYLEGFYYQARIDKELLEKHAEGLICLSGGHSSIFNSLIAQNKEQEALEKLRYFKKLFGSDYYLQIQRQKMSPEDLEKEGILGESWLAQNYREQSELQEKINSFLIDAATKENVELVACNAVHYLQRQDWKAHEILLNVQSGEPVEIWETDSMGERKRRIPNPKRRSYFSHEFYFKSPQEMQALFADLPQSIENSAKIAEKCKLEFDFSIKHYPRYIPPSLENKSFSDAEHKEETALFLKALCEENIPKRYSPAQLEKVQEKYPEQKPLDVIRERLDYELKVILEKNLSDYLLIVWDFINWAKNHNIPVGPGRGSGAGSIILYLIGITDIEPLRFHLFFERFINPERLSYPDIDVDICMDKRNLVIEYTLEKYGHENIAQIITFGSMKAKMAIKDVGRVLNIPLAKVNSIAKLVPEELNITIEKALQSDPDLAKLYQEDPETQNLLEIAKKLEGCVRNTGIHAAGVIISSSPLMEHIPICKSKDSDIAVTQFSMKPVEAVGMLKMDFLGLKTLTCIQKALDAVALKTGEKISYGDLPLDDKKTFDLLNQGKTLGIFQLESGGMQELARQLRLDRFEEIIAVVSLYRPGPMAMIPSFIARKHGQEKIEYDHEMIKDILDETYGIMVYQEQVMQIAQRLANYSLGEGDMLRRAMGKKDLKEMERQRQKFIDGALAQDISEEKASSIFDKIEKFASYGFNKSHAAAYGFLSYVTAYLKANHPHEWLAALMTCDRDDLSKVAKFIHEAQSMNIAILPPDVNESGLEFVGTEKGIRFALSAIKGLGHNLVESIIEERVQNGSFKSLYDFIQRVDHKKVGKKSIEYLVDAGCFDFCQWSRDALRQSIEELYQKVSKEKKESEKGILSLFSTLEKQEKEPVIEQSSTKEQLLMKEKELLGFFLTGHPMDAFQQHLPRLSCISLKEIHKLDDESIFRAAFIVEKIQTRISNKSQKKFAILTISEGLDYFELPIWPDLYEEKSELLKENQLIYALLELDKKEGIRLSCRWFDQLNKVDESMIINCDRAYERAKKMKERSFEHKKAKPKEPMKDFELILDAQKVRLSHILEIKKIFQENSGNSAVSIFFQQQNKELAKLKIDGKWGVSPSKNLQEALQKLPCLQKSS